MEPRYGALSPEPEGGRWANGEWVRPAHLWTCGWCALQGTWNDRWSHAYYRPENHLAGDTDEQLLVGCSSYCLAHIGLHNAARYADVTPRIARLHRGLRGFYEHLGNEGVTQLYLSLAHRPNGTRCLKVATHWIERYVVNPPPPRYVMWDGAAEAHLLDGHQVISLKSGELEEMTRCGLTVLRRRASWDGPGFKIGATILPGYELCRCCSLEWSHQPRVRIGEQR